MLNREDFIKLNYQAALNATAGTGIFPETLLAMAVVESQGKAQDGNWYPGLGLVARKANNFFGIKKESEDKKKLNVIHLNVVNYQLVVLVYQYNIIIKILLYQQNMLWL